MNLFYLDTHPKLAAQYHCDVHLRKMIIEGIQMLSTIHRERLGREEEILNPNTGRMRKVKVLGEESLYYRQEGSKLKLDVHNKVCCLPSHFTHPVTQWVNASSANYLWTCDLIYYMEKEYEFRMDKPHACYTSWYDYVRTLPSNMESPFSTPIVQMMPDEYKQEDPVEAYRAYYIGDKDRFATWKKRGAPSWWPPC